MVFVPMHGPVRFYKEVVSPQPHSAGRQRGQAVAIHWQSQSALASTAQYGSGFAVRV